jgi:hypothetical protein
VVRRLERDREAEREVATPCVALLEKPERLAVEDDRTLLRPAAPGLVCRRGEVLDGALGLAGLAPVVAERLV